MLYRYKDIIKDIYKYDANLKKAIKNKEIFECKYNLYSTIEHPLEIELIAKKYEKYIFNSFSAFYFHNLTDTIPTKYFIATKKKDRKINETIIKQTFMEDKYLYIGETYIEFNGVKIHCYDKERMLIELVRNKNEMSFDIYKEIVHNYRDIVEELDLIKLQEYLSYFSNKEKLFEMIHEEIL